MQSRLIEIYGRFPCADSTSITPEIEGALSPDVILNVLISGSESFFQHFVKQTDLLSRLNDESLRFLVNGFVTVTLQLRAYVSEWIDTGLADDGTERPLLRSLESMLAATRLAISEFLAEYPVRTTILDLGEPSQRLVCDVGCYSLLNGERRLPSNAEEAALACARSYFVALLMSPWKHRLCICRRCKGFLMLTRAPKENPYERGVLCDSCAGPASSVACTRENRKERRELLTALAAEVCSDLKCGCNAELVKFRSESVAKRVSAKLKRVQGKHYRGKWVGKKSCTAEWVRTYATEIAEQQGRVEGGGVRIVDTLPIRR